VDWLFLTGAICLIFLRAKGLEAGAGAVDERLVPAAREILKKAGATKIVLPSDFLTVRRSSPLVETVPATELLPAHVPMDIGHASRRAIETLVSQARTLFWSGPLGVWEIEPFGESTRTVAHVVAELAGDRLKGMICGESLTGALRQFGQLAGPLGEMITPSQPVHHFLSGQSLPGVEALERNARRAEDESRRLVLTVDSTGSLELVRQSAPLIKSAGLEIHLLLVDSPGREEHPPDSRPLQAATIFHRADALLAGFGLRAAAHSIKEGDPVECIIEYAREAGADLIAVPSLPLPAPLRILAGDWTQRLSKRLRFPILLTREPVR
jgi:nucleotide-binding universal stress UspA family protein